MVRFFFLLFCACGFATELTEQEVIAAASLKTTHHTIQLENGPLSYTAVTGMCPIFSQKGKEAELFFISYFKEGKEEQRPITFVFPGGPGGAGTIEAILAIGPRRLLTKDEGRSILPPYSFIDNPETLLESTDLIFVDPPNCGYSRTLEEADLSHYQSVEGDLQTLGEFVHSSLDFFQRWNSPIYLCGSSYGTTRCTGLSLTLLQHGLFVHGLILDGCALEFSTLISQRDHALPNGLLLPTLAATAWYHGRFWHNKPLREVLDYARQFAYERYVPFSLQPSRFTAAEREMFEAQLADLIGLPIATVKRYNGRIDEQIYTSEFFRSERKIIGGFDTRYSGDVAPIDPSHAQDPSYFDSRGYSPAFHHYLQKELNTHFLLKKYKTFSHPTNYSWNYNTIDTWGPPNFLQRLREALIINPQMKVFIGSGYYDCRTPFAATEYCFEHLDLPLRYKENLQFEYYEAGHGFIFDYPSLKKYKKDLVKFYAR